MNNQRPSLDQIFGQTQNIPVINITPAPNKRPSLDSIFGVNHIKNPQVASGAIVAPDDRFFSRVGRDIRERANKQAEIFASDANPIRKGWRLTGNAAGTVLDIGGEVIKNASTMLPSSVREASSEAGNYIAESLPAQYIGKKVGEFKQNYPEASKDIAAGLNIAAFANPIGRGAISATADTAKVAGRGVATVAKEASESTGLPAAKRGLKARDWEQLDATVKSMADETGPLFQRAKEIGADFRPDYAQNVLSRIKRDIVGSDRINDKLYPGTTALLEEIDKISKEPNIGLEQLNQIRQMANTIKSSPGDAHFGSRAVQSVDRIFETVRPANLLNGGREAVDLLQTAIPKWKNMHRFEDIATIIKRADGDPKKVRTGLKNLLLDKKKSRGFSPDQREAIRQAMKPSAKESFYNFLGAFGPDITQPNSLSSILKGGGNVAAGIFTGGASIPYSMAMTGANQVGKLIGRNSIENVLRKVETDYGNIRLPIREAEEVFPSQPLLLEAPRKQLPPPDDLLVSPNGSIRPQTAPERASAQSARMRLEDIGMTSDIRNIIRRRATREKYDPAFERAEQDAVQKIADDMKRFAAENQVKPESLVRNFMQRQKELSEATGESQQIGDIGYALLKAIRSR